ncbi:MAG: ISNCY family transposase [Isosphaeraceae bacterium]
MVPVTQSCPECQHRLWARYNNFRTITTLDGVLRLTLLIRRCINSKCPRFLQPYRPEAESHFALPYHEFGLDVMALVGRLRHAEHRSIPEIHRELTGRGLVVAERTVTNLLDRYDELRALATADPKRLGPLLRRQRRVILAIDGLQPDVGHEVLWVLRDCLSGEILLAKSLLSSTAVDLASLITEVRQALPVPITGVISDGQQSIRNAVAQALPGVPHQLCQFHSLREAAKPISEADRHAKKKLKKRVRGVRRIERQAAATTDELSVATGLKHFLKVTKSYWPGLFKCYPSSDLPRTNNDLEHVFSSHRYHDRRASGRRRASPGLVVLGSARVISSLATRLRPEEGLVLRPGYVPRWQELRAELDARRESRRKQRRFRPDPARYLRGMEQRCLQLLLPA